MSLSSSNVVEAPVLEKKEVNYDPLIQWIDELKEYESRGRPERFRILDVNGKYSYSCLQFQEETFIANQKKFDVKGGDIYDCDTQMKLALLMISNDHKEWRNWYTSVKKRGLGEPPKIEIPE